MHSKPLNHETFVADVCLGALVVCAEIDTAIELLKGALEWLDARTQVTFTTDASEALNLASADHSRIVFTLGATEAVITF